MTPGDGVGVGVGGVGVAGVGVAGVGVAGVGIAGWHLLVGWPEQMLEQH